MKAGNFVKGIFTFTFLAGSAVVFSSTADADSARWSAEKRDQVNVSRNSDAGVGNGGEARIGLGPSDNWVGTTNGEDGWYDRDPGGSEGRNEAAKNDDKPQSSAGGGTGIPIYPGY